MFEISEPGDGELTRLPNERNESKSPDLMDSNFHSDLCSLPHVSNRQILYLFNLLEGFPTGTKSRYLCPNGRGVNVGTF